MIYGTISTLDALATSQQSVAQFGEDKAWEGVSTLLAAYNMQVMEDLADFVEPTEDLQRRYGGGSVDYMDEVDQYGRADASKAAQGTTVAFPLRKYQRSIQWTRDGFEVMTGKEFMGQIDQMLLSDAATVRRAIKRALFNPTNYTFNDVLVNNIALGVKALVNADSAEIPPGPNGESFTAASHTHYLYSSAWDAAALTALIATVVEHFATGVVVVEINQAQETLTRAFTGFTAVTDAQIINASTTSYAAGELDVINFNNRFIGVFNGARIYVKSGRVPASYQLAYMKGAPEKPLVLRRRNAARAMLRLVADNESYPLRAQTREREVGFGAWNRVAAAVNYSAASGSYVAPTF
jgi:hypothetical protein